MINITVVTTFNEDGMKLYGQRFLDSFATNVGNRVKMICYAEKCAPNNPNPRQITILDADTTLHKLVRFKEKWRDIKSTNFRYDVVRFAHKSYTMFHACQNLTDWCVWMDGDTFIHAPWSYNQFLTLLPGDKWLTYVGRGINSKVNYPETGFVSFNLKYDTCREFVIEYERMYEDAENGVFLLPQYHDCIVIQNTINKFIKYRHQMLDYSTDIHPILFKKSRHPLINGVLGTWIDHLKGDRKRLGKSSKTDIVIDRKEKYWN